MPILIFFGFLKIKKEIKTFFATTIGHEDTFLNCLKGP